FQALGVITLFLDDGWNPVFINFVAGKLFNKGFPRHTALADAESDDVALFIPYALKDGANAIVQRIELAWGKLEKLEQFAQCIQFFDGLRAIATMLGNSL